jgi:hypothetical protein
VATPTEWNLLKHQFDALVHDEIVDADSIEKIFDEQVRRRFAEIINRAVEGRTLAGIARSWEMNQRDLELLDKELWGVSPNPRLERDALGLMVIVAFVGGLLMGGTLFAHKYEKTQMTSYDAASVLSLLSESPPARQ